MSTNTKTPVPSIVEKSILSNLRISIPGNVRKDRKLTEEVIEQKKIEAKSGRWLKNRFPNETFAPFLSVQGEARSYHYFNSLPWGTDGSRILSVKNYFTYLEGMRKIKSKFEDLIDDHFCANYDKWLTKAQEMHGSTFDPSEYSSCEIERKKFGFDIAILPVPSKNDFRVNMDKEILDEMKEQLDSRIEQAIQETNKDLWRRLAEPIEKMVEKLTDKEAGFHASLVGNIKDIVGLIPDLVIVEDPQLEAIRKVVADTLAKLDCENLRENEEYRKTAAEAASEILSNLKSYC